MQQVSDAFLLNMAEVSATLIGLFLVGVFFYVETGLRRWGQAREALEPYLRAGTRITLIVFAIPLGVSLTLVALEPSWARVFFALLSVMLLAANVDSVVRIRGRCPSHRIDRLAGERGGDLGGGSGPGRHAVGFLTIGATVMSAFDIARLDAAERTG
jgi:hypothetical protein